MLAETYGIPESSVVVVARFLREAGWLTTGARGVNAPHMTSRDAARLSIALLSGQPPSLVVEEFEFLRSLRAKDACPEAGFTTNYGLALDHSLEDAVTLVFGLTSASPIVQEHGWDFMDRRIWPEISVSVDASARAGHISLPGHSTAYEDVAKEVELTALEAAPFSPERLARQLELWDRSGSWDSGSVVYGRGMRVIRTITSTEVQKICEALAGDDQAP